MTLGPLMIDVQGKVQPARPTEERFEPGRADFGRVTPGDVIVCRTTDPACPIGQQRYP